MSIRFGFVGTYPPTHCGIATFSYALMKAIDDLPGHTTSIVRLVEADHEEAPVSQDTDLAATIISGDAKSMSHGISTLNEFDVAVVQHEFGIFGGPEGDEVLDIMKGLQIPSIVVVHTVLPEPTWYQRFVFTEMIRLASAVVVMSQTSHDLLISKYFVNSTKIFLIPHGAPEFPIVKIEHALKRPLILTWGLIGPGKGIEWAIEAFDSLRDLSPAPRYLVAGRTHPKVLEREGEAYRRKLNEMIASRGLEDYVELNADYMSTEALATLVSSASVVLLPYDSVNQMTSGVLIEAITAGRPVIATGFPHATELLADGAGIVVPHQDPAAIAQALRSILEDSVKAAFMSKRAMDLGRGFLWSSVAKGYVKLAGAVMSAAEVAA